MWNGLNEAYSITVFKGHLVRFVGSQHARHKEGVLFSGKGNHLKQKWLKPISSVSSVCATESAVSRVMK